MSAGDLEQFRRSIGRRVLFTSPVSHTGRGRTERGVITGVDDRMVYVDYGYANPVWPELGNSIATHPANLSLAASRRSVASRRRVRRPAAAVSAPTRERRLR